MSNIDTRHNVLPFESGKSKPLNGQRMAKIGYKTTKKQVAKYKNHFVSVPPLNMDEIKSRADDLAVFLIPVLESAQDGIIKSLFESSGGTLTSVSDEEISISSCIAYLHAQMADEKMLLGSWFDSDIAEAMTPIVCAKLGFDGELTTDQELKIISVLDQYRELVQRLANTKDVIEPGQRKLIRRMIELSECEDSFALDKVNARLDALDKKPDMAALLEL